MQDPLNKRSHFDGSRPLRHNLKISINEQLRSRAEHKTIESFDERFSVILKEGRCSSFFEFFGVS
ncbi:hypothetical protein BSM4216_0508 [Bacillus smithii]|nr:hypothetical protein BSM4216_0508 [Bacillus smithii]